MIVINHLTPSSNLAINKDQKSHRFIEIELTCIAIIHLLIIPSTATACQYSILTWGITNNKLATAAVASII